MSFYRRRWEQPRTYTCNLISLWLSFRVGESSSSTDATPPSTESAEDRAARGTKCKAEDQLPDVRDRCEQPERADEIPVPKASSSVSPNVIEVTRLPTQGRKMMQIVKNIRQRGRHDWKPSAVSLTETMVNKNKSSTDRTVDISAVMRRSSSGN